MKVMQVQRFKCDVCGHVYEDQARAEKCESRPVQHDRGVKVGETVKITHGDGAGHTGTVERVYVIDREWGHYAWERYWHTVALVVKVNGSWGHRTLTFDNYETIKRPNA